MAHSHPLIPMHVLATVVLDSQLSETRQAPGKGVTFHGTDPQNDGLENCLLMGWAKPKCDSEFAIIVTTRICSCGQGFVKRCNKGGVPSTSSFSPLMTRQLWACWISEAVATLAKALGSPTLETLTPRGHLKRLQTVLAGFGPSGLTRGFWKWRLPDKQDSLEFFPFFLSFFFFSLFRRSTSEQLSSASDWRWRRTCPTS